MEVLITLLALIVFVIIVIVVYNEYYAKKTPIVAITSPATTTMNNSVLLAKITPLINLVAKYQLCLKIMGGLSPNDSQLVIKYAPANGVTPPQDPTQVSLFNYVVSGNMDSNGSMSSDYSALMQSLDNCSPIGYVLYAYQVLSTNTPNRMMSVADAATILTATIPTKNMSNYDVKQIDLASPPTLVCPAINPDANITGISEIVKYISFDIIWGNVQYIYYTYNAPEFAQNWKVAENIVNSFGTDCSTYTVSNTPTGNAVKLDPFARVFNITNADVTLPGLLQPLSQSSIAGAVNEYFTLVA